MEKLLEVKSCRPLNYGQSTEAISNISWALYRQLTIGIPSTLIKLGEWEEKGFNGLEDRECSELFKYSAEQIDTDPEAGESNSVDHTGSSKSSSHDTAVEASSLHANSGGTETSDDEPSRKGKDSGRTFLREVVWCRL